MLRILLPTTIAPASHTLLQATMRAFCRTAPDASRAVAALLSRHAAALAMIPLHAARKASRGAGSHTNAASSAQQATRDGAAGDARLRDSIASQQASGFCDEGVPAQELAGQHAEQQLCNALGALGLDDTNAGSRADDDAMDAGAEGAPDDAGAVRHGSKPGSAQPAQVDECAANDDGSTALHPGPPASADVAAADARFSAYCTLLGTAAMEQLCALEQTMGAQRSRAAAQAGAETAPGRSSGSDSATHAGSGAEAGDAGGLAGITGGGALDMDEMQVRVNNRMCRGLLRQELYAHSCPLTRVHAGAQKAGHAQLEVPSV